MSIGTIERMMHVWSRLRTRLFSSLIGGQFCEFGTGARIAPPFRFYGCHRMRLGEKVQIERNCWIQTIGPAGDDSVKLVIGAHTGIGMGATISAAQQVTIGEYVLLARNVYISDHAHAFEDIKVPIMQQGICNLKSVSIGNHTWLGQNVVILPGVTIGKHCVIGANSVVNASVPDYSIAVGSPARVVKQHDPATGRWTKVNAV
jgi:acetyltransferase-like isoleucine patch superfamily enzyme